MSSPALAAAAGRPARLRPGMVLAAIILFDVLVRLRLLNMPLERDEGEFAYFARLMLEGIMPYKVVNVIKLPGAPLFYALSMALFGQSPAGIHCGLLLVNLAAVIMVYFLARRWFGAGVGLIASAAFMLMSLSYGVNGNAAHTEQFVIAAALGGVLLLLRSLDTNRLAVLLASGILFGLAFLFKQPGIFFGLYGGLLILARELGPKPDGWSRFARRVMVFGLGLVLPFAILCFILWRGGVLDRFWFWSFTVAGGRWMTEGRAWDSMVDWLDSMRITGLWSCWVLVALAVPVVWSIRGARFFHLPFVAFCIASLAAVRSGAVLQVHYFVCALPAAGMWIGLGVVETRQFLKNSPSLAGWSFLPPALFAAACAGVLYVEGFYMFTASPREASQIIYRGNPFCEAENVADYIRTNSVPNCTIAVLGSEPEIYFLARRHAATAHLSTYILMENHPYSNRMQEEMAQEIETARPEYIVFVPLVTSWLPKSRSPGLLMNEMKMFIDRNYKMTGIAASPWPEEAAKFYTGDIITNVPHAGGVSLMVYKIQPSPSANHR